MIRFEEPPGSTPLDVDEIAGLIPRLLTQGELNEAEADNIMFARVWLRSLSAEWTILFPSNLKQLHQRMFCEVWRWAGKPRKTAKNIGVESYRIESELKNLCEDVKTWIEYESYPRLEIITRFHHRLVVVHPFSNGNGRHARLAAERLAVELGSDRPNWDADRVDNIKSLRAADRGGFQLLLDLMWPHSGSR
ncbi:MAG: mobile mystery protein B [Armatimonadota bacterium]